MDLFPFIFHEKQEGQLCAQHALNALLQGAYFTAVDLADIGRQLDEEERSAMAEGNIGGHETEEYRKFLGEESSNYDDSGFFSVQVISRALKVWGLEITAFGSELAVGARDDPTQEQAFVCNLQEHWFTLRRFGNSPKRWYNLNSVFDGPDYVSETYLGLLLAQLQNEGYSIFIVNGTLAPSEADIYAESSPVPDPSQIPKKPSSTTPRKTAKGWHPPAELGVRGQGVGGSAETEGGDDELARAIALSLGTDFPPPPQQPAQPFTLETDSEDDDPDLRIALQQSLSDAGSDSKSLQQALEASRREAGLVGTEGSVPPVESERERKRDREVSEPPEQTQESLDPAELRRRRLERFGG
ncbi:Ataxin-3 [Fimicolochytrium jonesii]|uniref:Ataxin-3 n=1 Tax=Fimicolochytrium jonesii TaxID=1396493 RepID=UPI0022FDF6C8|nr:Ataxin-3 [Fimicolochytrium jonesii]KAI8816310.1 Ataxin-3 [Fimicolochytrium jonesii]